METNQNDDPTPGPVTLSRATVVASTHQEKAKRMLAEAAARTAQVAETKAEVIQAGRDARPPAAPEGDPITPSMLRVMQARLENAGITPEQFAEKWSFTPEQTTRGLVNECLAWCATFVPK